MQGFRQVFCDCCEPTALRLWVVAIAFALPLGIYSGWTTVLAINLQTFGVSASAAGWLGFWMTLGGSLAGVVMGAVADSFRGNMKGAILVCYTICTLGFLWFAIIATGGHSNGTESAGNHSGSHHESGSGSMMTLGDAGADGSAGSTGDKASVML